MMQLAEQVTGRNLDAFFEVFFREATYPYLRVERLSDETQFTWITETNVPLDLDVFVDRRGSGVRTTQ